MEPSSSFHYEIETSKDDQFGKKVTTIKCHGRLVFGNAREIKELVKPLLALGGRTVIDLGDLNYLDSSGLGALVGLKVSAINQGLGDLKFVNMTSRVLELLRVTKLVEVFSS